MIIGSVNSKELDSKKGLRAEDYVINPKRMAENIVHGWLADCRIDKMIKPSSPQMKHLRSLIQQAIHGAYVRGKEAR